MEIKIMEGGMNTKSNIVFSDDMMDNDDFVTIKIADEQGKWIQADFPISELMPALIAFDAKRSRSASQELDEF